MIQKVYTRHKPSRKKFKRNRVIANGIDDLWQIDLADVSNISKHNSKYRYLTTCIDVFSKFAWVIPIKNKIADTVLDGFKEIISSLDVSLVNFKQIREQNLLIKKLKLF
jgi:hypothetical protein